jgi:hypothetical protein
MHPFIRAWVSFVFLSWGVAVPVLRAAEEPAEDLHPLDPVSRAIFSGNQQFHMMSGGVSSQVFSADGKTLFMSGHMGLTIWDLAGSKPGQPRTLRLDNFFPHNATLALSADGKTAAALSMMGGNQDMPIRFFDTATGKETRQIENDQQINGLSFSPDGRFLAVSTYPRIELWDAANGDEVRVFTTEANTFYRLLVFSPDGKMLAAVAQFNRFPQPAEPSTVIQIWETASGKERMRVRLAATPMQAPNQRRVFYAQGANGLAFSTDSRFLAASGNDSAIHLWDLHTGKESASLSGFEGNAGALLFAPDGRELLAMDLKGNRLAWKMADIRRLHSARLPPLSESAFAALWTELAQTDAFRAYRAERHLLADPKRAVALLAGQLKPVPPGDTVRLRQLAADLGNASGAVRRKAMMELRAKHGEAALGALPQTGNVRRNNFGMSFEQKLRDLYNTPERARDLKAVRILEAIGTREARQVLEKLSQGAAGVRLTTESKSALDRLTAAKERPTTPPTDALWADLASDDAGRAYRAMCSLSATPPQALALFQKELKPIPVAEDTEIATLLGNLEADDFKVREQATQELEKLGEQAVPALKNALAGKPALEARKRMEHLLEHLTSQTSAVALRGLRALEVLEHAGTAEAKHVLVALAGGAPPALLTREAKACLQRLSRR